MPKQYMEEDEDDTKPYYKPPEIKASHKGLLHKKLGIPQGQKIPLSKLMKAKKSSSPSIRKEATFAVNFR